MLEKILSLIPLIAELFEGLKVEVSSFEFRKITNSGSDGLVWISAHPVAYWVDLSISNSSQKCLGVKRVVLSVNADSFQLDEYNLPKVFLPANAVRFPGHSIARKMPHEPATIS